MVIVTYLVRKVGLKLIKVPTNFQRSTPKATLFGHLTVSMSRRMGSCIAKEGMSPTGSPKKVKIEDGDCIDGGDPNDRLQVDSKTDADSNAACGDVNGQAGGVNDANSQTGDAVDGTSVQTVAISVETPTKSEEEYQNDYFNGEAVGITEFIPSNRSNPGFRCIMKKRYSDFLVNEIDIHGNVVRLTDLSCPVSSAEDITKDGAIEWLTSKLSIEQMDQLNAMTAKKCDKRIKVSIDVDAMDKDERTKVHKCVKAAFGGKLFTQTEAKNVDTKVPSDEIFPMDASEGPDDLKAPATNANIQKSSPNKDAAPMDTTSPNKSLGEGQSINPGTEKKFITIGLVNNWKGTAWTVPGKDFTTFTVYAEQRGTTEVIRTLATMLRMDRKSFWINGTKDKKSVMVQRMCGFHVRPERLASISDHLRKNVSPIAIGNFSFEKDHLKLGHSLGNHFKIVFRDVKPVGISVDCDGKERDADGDDEILSSLIRESFENIKNNGFINYFGTQRFGSGTRTDKIGALLIKKQFKEAIEGILVPKKKDIVVGPKELPLPDNFQSNYNPTPTDASSGDAETDATETKDAAGGNHRWPKKAPKQTRTIQVPSYNECMSEWQVSKDSDGVYKAFHWKKSNEGLILKMLTQTRNNWRSAFLSLPRNARTMYLHAYQSSIWNRIVSERIKKYGLQVLIGDLVIVNEGQGSGGGDLEKEDEKLAGKKKKNRKDKKGKKFEKETPKDEESEDEDFPSDKRMKTPTIVTPEMVEKVTIFDVVLPMVGSKVLLPENEFKDRLLQMLAEDGITLQNFVGNDPLSLKGSYRKIIAKPDNLSWELVNYTDETVRLFDTDLDMILGVQGRKDGVCPKDDETEDKKKDAEVKKALKVEVSLGSSTYATIFARELTKGHVDMEWSRAVEELASDI